MTIDTSPIVDESKAPLGRRPKLLGIEYLRLESRGGKQRYRCEAWQLTTGRKAVIVTDNGGTSLVNASEGIAKMVRDRWPGELTIIEDWTADPEYNITGHRFHVSTEDGGQLPFDHDAWDQRGLVLPR